MEAMARLARIARRLSRLPAGWILYPALVWFLHLVVMRAWVAEDAYITFRVIENAFSGYGLRWNIHERVQVYTHPLWMLLQLLVFSV